MLLLQLIMKTNDLLLLACFGKIGPRGYQKLLDAEIAKDILSVSATVLTKAGIKSEIAHEFVAFREPWLRHPSASSPAAWRPL